MVSHLVAGALKNALAVTLCSLVILPGQVRKAPSVLRVKVLEGDGAINNIRELRAKDPVVQVEDDEGRALQGVPVTFILPTMGPSVVFPDGKNSLTVLTDSKGQATARGLRPNNVAGQFSIQITASHQGETVRAAIKQTNAAPAIARKGGSGKKVAIIGLLAAGAAAGAAFATKGGSKTNPPPIAPASTPGTVVVPGGTTLGPP